MELLAVIVALEKIKKEQHMCIYIGFKVCKRISGKKMG